MCTPVTPETLIFFYLRASCGPKPHSQIYKWYAYKELNPNLSVRSAMLFPLSYRRMVCLERFELSTPRAQSECSGQTELQADEFYSVSIALTSSWQNPGLLLNKLRIELATYNKSYQNFSSDLRRTSKPRIIFSHVGDKSEQ